MSELHPGRPPAARYYTRRGVTIQSSLLLFPRRSRPTGFRIPVSGKMFVAKRSAKAPRVHTPRAPSLSGAQAAPRRSGSRRARDHADMSHACAPLTVAEPHRSFHGVCFSATSVPYRLPMPSTDFHQTEPELSAPPAPM